jgi:hypothetical protein
MVPISILNIDSILILIEFMTSSISQLFSSSKLYNLFTVFFVISLFSSSRADFFSSITGSCIILAVILLDIYSIRLNSFALNLSCNFFNTLSVSSFRIFSPCSYKFNMVGTTSVDFNQFSNYVYSSSRMNSAYLANLILAWLFLFTTSCRSSTS